MFPKRVAIVRSSDWEALYFDGIKTLEGHSIPLFDVFESLGLTLESRPELGAEQLEAIHWEFPDDEKDLP